MEHFKSSSAIIGTLHSLVNVENSKDRVKFYVHVYHFLANCLKVKAKSHSARIKLDREVELADVYGGSMKDLFKPHHVFPPEELDVIVKEHMKMQGDCSGAK